MQEATSEGKIHRGAKKINAEAINPLGENNPLKRDINPSGKVSYGGNEQLWRE
jgi:hypothetical protein